MGHKVCLDLQIWDAVRKHDCKKSAANRKLRKTEAPKSWLTIQSRQNSSHLSTRMQTEMGGKTWLHQRSPLYQPLPHCRVDPGHETAYTVVLICFTWKRRNVTSSFLKSSTFKKLPPFLFSFRSQKKITFVREISQITRSNMGKNMEGHVKKDDYGLRTFYLLDFH